MIILSATNTQLMRLNHFFSFLLFLLSLSSNAQSWQSNLVRLNESTGELSYSPDPVSGTRIPDFSRAGYQGGGVPLPILAVKKTISPLPGDNTAHIQAAINEVSGLPLDASGFRGALLLRAGTYKVSGVLAIKASGVVLRGVGNSDNPSNSTIIYATGNSPDARTVLTLGGGTITDFEDQVAGSRTNIITPLVRAGDKSFEVADASSYQVGDNIIIHHPCTAEWLEAIDFGGTVDQSERWKVDEHPLIYNTRIERIECNRIFTNSPVFNDLDLSLSPSFIYKYRRVGLLENIGLENLRIDIQHDTSNPSDLEHARTAVELVQLENGWVDRCAFLHFAYAGVDTYTANYITVSNTESLDPIAPTDGGLKYNFTASRGSQNILFTKCIATKGRHAYVSNGTSSVAGIVFHDCQSIDPLTSSEGHRRWTTGMLFDRFIDQGELPRGNRVLAFYNRGDFGTGHGWSAVNSVAWNCDTRRSGTDGQILIQRPPIGQNFAIGCKGTINGNGPFSHPAGYIEGSNDAATLVPSSLYNAQLNARKDLEPLSTTDVVVACQPYTWIDGITYTSTNNTATFEQVISPNCSLTKRLDLTYTDISSEIIRTSTTLIATQPDAQYLWEDCDGGVLTNHTNREFEVLANGSYALTVTKNGCSVKSSCTNAIVGLDEVSNQELAIYPNPTQGQFKIKLSAQDIGSDLVIYNTNGQVVHRKSNVKTQTLSVTINTSGLYTGELKTPMGEVRFFKIVVTD